MFRFLMIAVVSVFLGQPAFGQINADELTNLFPDVKAAKAAGGGTFERGADGKLKIVPDVVLPGSRAHRVRTG